MEHVPVYAGNVPADAEMRVVVLGDGENVPPRPLAPHSRALRAFPPGRHARPERGRSFRSMRARLRDNVSTEAASLPRPAATAASVPLAMPAPRVPGQPLAAAWLLTLMLRAWPTGSRRPVPSQ